MSRDGTVRRTARRLTAGGSQSLEEAVAEEVAVALVYNGISYAVMMATPCDLEDFARGFSLTERIVEKASEIYDIEAEPMGRGIEVRLEIAAQRLAGLQERRRSLAGRTGCGLCGVDSLDAALRTVPSVAQPRPVSRLSIERAMAALPAQQRLNRASGALHAAAWAAPDGGWSPCARMSAGTTRSTSWRCPRAKRRGRCRRFRGRDEPLFLRDGAEGRRHRRLGHRGRLPPRPRSRSRRRSRRALPWWRSCVRGA